MRFCRLSRIDFLSLASVVFVLACLGATSAAASSIQDRLDYRPSTDIFFTDSGSLTGGGLLGNTPVSGQFQLNLAYYNAVPADRAAVDQFNDNCLNGPPPGGCDSPTGLNWVDPEYYTLTMSMDDSADVWSNDVLVMNADWSITGKWGTYEHTILFGDLIDEDSSLSINDGDYLDISPPGYHSFFGEGWANANEPWNLAVIPTEVAGYSVFSTGPNEGLLSVHIVPESATALLLLVGLAGLAYLRR